MSLYNRLRNLGRTDRLNREIERELAFHVEEKAAALRAAGWSDADALREARRRVGNVDVQRERTRDADVIGWLDWLLRDVRHAVRGLRRTPVFTFVAVASLALGIGANTAIFTLIDAVVLRPLPVAAPEELVILGMSEDESVGYFTNPLWEQVRDNQSGLSAVAAFSHTRFNTAAGGEARWVDGAWVSGDYFRVFGVRPALGRLFTAADDARGCIPLAVLSHGYWQGAFGGDPAALGQRLTLEGTSFEIIGVAAEGFRGADVGDNPQVFLPLCAEAAVADERSMLDARSAWWLNVMGRREPGLTMTQLEARLAAIAPAAYAATLPQQYPAEHRAEYLSGSFHAHPAPTGMSQMRNRYAGALLILMSGVGLILVIACANVANLLLARATARQREFAIRVAIGAGRARLARLLVTESLLIATLGAGIGLLFARFGAQALLALFGGESVALDLSLNARVLGFTTAVAVLTALLFGLIPAWRAGRVDPQSAMTANGRTIAEGHGRFTLGKALVAAQVALSLVLLVGAGLLVGSLRNLVLQDPGFSTEGVLLASVDLQRTGFPEEQILRARGQLVEQLRASPGVLQASAADITPVAGPSWNGNLIVDGFTPASEMDGVAWFNAVNDGYFATLGTPLLAGRDFDARDVAGGVNVAIVNRSVARKFFGEENPVGRQFATGLGDDVTTYTVIGVVGDAKYRSLREEDSGTVYLAASQMKGSPMSMVRPFLTLAVRTDGDPTALVPTVKAALAGLHPAAGVEFRTFTEQVERSLQRERMLATLSALFGGVALALAMLGLYGVLSYSVARRRNEIGVRIAIGAGRGRVIRMVLGDVARVLAIGLVLGAVGALASGRLVGAFLYGLEPGEPAVLAGAAAALAAVAVAAGMIPAWRAARMDPTLALREE